MQVVIIPGINLNNVHVVYLPKYENSIIPAPYNRPTNHKFYIIALFKYYFIIAGLLYLYINKYFRIKYLRMRPIITHGITDGCIGR